MTTPTFLLMGGEVTYQRRPPYEDLRKVVWSERWYLTCSKEMVPSANQYARAFSLQDAMDKALRPFSAARPLNELTLRAAAGALEKYMLEVNGTPVSVLAVLRVIPPQDNEERFEQV